MMHCWFLFLFYFLFKGAVHSPQTPPVHKKQQADNIPAPKHSKLRTIIIDPGHGYPDPGAKGSFSDEATVTLAIAKKLGAKIEKTFPDIKVVYTRNDSNLPKGLSLSREANHERANIANQAKGDLYLSIHADSERKKFKKILQGYKNQTITVKDRSGKKIKKTKKAPYYKRSPLPHTITGSSVYIIASHKNEDKYEAVKENMDFGEDESIYESIETNYPEMLARAAVYSKRFFKKSNLLATLIDEELKQKNRPTFGVKQRSQGIWVLQATSMPSVLIEIGYICTPEDEKYINSETGQTQIVAAIVKAIQTYRTFIDQEKDKKSFDKLLNEVVSAKTKVEEETPETAPTKTDSLLKNITVASAKIKLEILNNIEQDPSLFSIYENTKSLYSHQPLSHTTAKTFTIDLSAAKSKKIIFSAEALKEVDQGHLEIQLITGKKDTLFELFIPGNKNIVLPVTYSPAAGRPSRPSKKQ